MQVLGLQSRIHRGAECFQGRRLPHHRGACAAHARRQVVVRAGLFDFLTPKPPTSPRAGEIVEEVLSLAKGTDKGLRCSPQRSEEIETLLEELAGFGAGNSVRSRSFWGDYDLIYSSAPQSAAGGLSPASFSGQKIQEILEQPNAVTFYAENKGFGLLPGYVKQSGTLKAQGGDTYQVTFSELENKSAFGPASVTEIDNVSKFQVLYLDDNLRVVKYLADNGEEEALLIYSRAGASAAPQRAKAAEPAERPPGTAVLFGGRKREGMATQVEREVAKQIDAQKAKLQGRDAEKSRVERERQASKSAAEAAAAKERAEAEKQAEKDRRQAAKDALDAVVQEFKQKQQLARDASKELKDLERANSPILRSVAQAQNKIAQAETRTKGAADRLAAAGQKRKDAEDRVRQAQAAIKNLEAAVRTKVEAASKL